MLFYLLKTSFLSSQKSILFRYCVVYLVGVRFVEIVVSDVADSERLVRPVSDRWPHSVQPRALIAASRNGEGGSRQLLGVQAVGALLGVVLVGQGARTARVF